MALPRSKKRSATVFSRDEIGVEQLQSLKEKFADGDLNEKEFVSLFREIVDASLSEAQLTELFQKIDANSDGTVDWDELTNYMFLSGSANDEYTGDDGNSCYDTAFPEKFSGDACNGAAASASCAPTDIMGNVTGGSGGSLGLGLLPHHKDVITRVIRLDRPSVYLTTSKDGSVRTWSANSLAPQQVLASGRDWLTDCCVMKRSNRSQRAVATLKGHTSSVLHLVSDDDNFQIVSAAADNTVKPCLMTATTQLTRWAVKSSSGTGSQAEDMDDSPAGSTAATRKWTPKERSNRLACYNSVFHQVVTAGMDSESAIKTWSAETGDEISSFSHPHNSSPVTCISFDHAGRRLLTGSHDGEQLKMWNFSNGALVKQFYKKEPPIVSSLLSTTTPATAATAASNAALSDDPSTTSGTGNAAKMAAAPRKRKLRVSFRHRLVYAFNMVKISQRQFLQLISPHACSLESLGNRPISQEVQV
ncbi:hypothetical protein PHYBOEH_007603 [Phytophthora boehmeriae]|uniref:EF-hand domain-containing protein n=1 Tax=Phytophthora boehmeriae TaxID=109152 RepID=A0A8T1X1C9_9STRA|nr:hypothetical protein PHYBOEH_007603 [Phytophthora boehmeriae]